MKEGSVGRRIGQLPARPERAGGGRRSGQEAARKDRRADGGTGFFGTRAATASRQERKTMIRPDHPSLSIGDLVDFYNHRRPHAAHGGKTPVR